MNEQYDSYIVEYYSAIKRKKTCDICSDINESQKHYAA